MISTLVLKLGLGVIALALIGIFILYVRRTGRDAERLRAAQRAVEGERNRAQIEDDIRRAPADDRGLRGYQR